MDIERIYHKGQEKTWDSNVVLEEAIEKHGKTSHDPLTRAALLRIVSLIEKGEEVAWENSLFLASVLDDTGAKAASTSQANDEFRHMHVFKEYARLVLGEMPSESGMSGASIEGLRKVRDAGSAEEKILCTHLLVEPVAISLFRTLRERNVDPVLTHILEYVERDEARHIAIGTVHLPELLRDSSWPRMLKMVVSQMRTLFSEIEGLRTLVDDLKILGIEPIRLFEVAEKKQLEAFRELEDHLGTRAVFTTLMDWYLGWEKGKFNEVG